jgi:carbonic anhydrase/acetyltransferase-like protein (isoleucine patch superfamily)
MADGVTRAASSARSQLVSLEPRLALALALAGVLPPYTGNALRVRLLRLGGLTIGQGTGIGGRLWVAGGARPSTRLAIGADCFLNDGCRFDVSAPVTVGDRVYLGHEVAVLTASHELGTSARRAGASLAQPVSIGDGCWIGARATVMGGVTIGEGAVVAAGAVVTRSVSSNTMVGGVPATEIRSLDR